MQSTAVCIQTVSQGGYKHEKEGEVKKKGWRGKKKKRQKKTGNDDDGDDF